MTDVAVPDLSKWGVSEADAQRHITTCARCRQSYEHAAQNRRDALALAGFGQQVASCLRDERDRLRRS